MMSPDHISDAADGFVVTVGATSPLWLQQFTNDAQALTILGVLSLVWLRVWLTWRNRNRNGR